MDGRLLEITLTVRLVRDLQVSDETFFLETNLRYRLQCRQNEF